MTVKRLRATNVNPSRVLVLDTRNPNQVLVAINRLTGTAQATLQYTYDEPFEGIDLNEHAGWVSLTELENVSEIPAEAIFEQAPSAIRLIVSNGEGSAELYVKQGSYR